MTVARDREHARPTQRFLASRLLFRSDKDWSAEMRIGVDMVEIGRFGRAMKLSSGLASRMFTPGELEIAKRFGPRRREQFLAGRFAVKEAVLKALGTGIGGDIELTDIESLPVASGAPQLKFLGAARDALSSHALTRYNVSLSHDAGFVMAFVVLT